jgi:APA family basic amino acid/polyamine antiporter
MEQQSATMRPRDARSSEGTVSPPPAGREEFVKAFSRFDAVMFVAGSMIGSAIFIVPADIIRQVGSPGLLLLVWAITGVVIVFGALSYGELSAMYPHTGGLYIYLREGLSPLYGYLYGWALFCVIQSGAIAAVGVAFARFAAVLFPALTPDVFWGVTLHLPSGAIDVGLSWQRVLAIVSILALTWINIRGVKTAAALQTGLTVLKTSALCALIVIGLTIGRHPAAVAANFGSHFWPASGFHWSTLPIVGTAMVGSIAAADLWYQIGYAGGEMKDAQRDIPVAMVRGALLVTILYFLANVAYLSILPADAIAAAPQDRVGSTALQAVFGAPGLYAMAAAVALSCFGCNAALILSAPRVYYAMARDGLFFAAAGRLHPRFKTPSAALIAQAVWSSLLCLSGTYSQLLEYMVFASLLFYLLTVFCVFSLRARRPDAERPVKAVGYPVLPALYLVVTALLCIDLLVKKPQYTWPGLIIVASGIPIYYLWRALARPQEPGPAGEGSA